MNNMNNMKKNTKYLELALDIASSNVKINNCGPFGAVIVKNNQIISKCGNSVTSDNDPTAHAEVNAIREA